MSRDLRDLLDDADRELAPLEKAYFLAEWKVAQEATDDGEQALVDASLAYDTALADQERYGALLAAETRNGTRDTSLRRRLTVLRNGAAARQRPRDLAEAILRREASLASLYSLHRGELGGAQVSDNEIEEVLRTSTDPAERRAAWEASKSIGPGASDQVRELGRAAQRGRPGARLPRPLRHDRWQLDELDERWLYHRCSTGSSALAPAVAGRARRPSTPTARGGSACPPTRTLVPWDYGDPFFQDPPPAPDDRSTRRRPVSTRWPSRGRYFAGARPRRRRDPGPQRPVPAPRQDQHAFRITDRARSRHPHPVQRRAGLRWLETMLHELGHAIYDDAIDPRCRGCCGRRRTPSPPRRSRCCTAGGPATAMFLRRFAGIDGGRRRPGEPRVVRRDLHVFAAWVQVMARFERSLYADPTPTSPPTWWELVERTSTSRRPDGTAARLGGEDPPGTVAGLLPQLPARPDDGVAARGGAGPRDRRAQPGRRSRRRPARCCASGSCARARRCAGTR